MARTTGPLFSFDASGTIAGAVVFSKWRGRSYVRRHAIPANPRSALQVSVRVMLSFLARQWQALSPSDQATWDTPAAAANYSPFNAYVAANMNAWKHYQHPSNVYPRDPISPQAGSPNLVLTGVVGLLTAVIAAGAPVPDSGYSLHLQLSSPVTASKANAVAVELYPAGDLTIVIAPLVADTYYLVAVPFNVDGVTGIVSNEANAVVT